MFSVNFQSSTPVYRQIYENVVRLVSLGILKPNEKLPPVRALAPELGVNPNTVSKAYNLLESDGYIYSTVGRGSFVCENIDIVATEQENAKADLRKALVKSHSLGISKREVDNMVKEIYTGGEEND